MENGFVQYDRVLWDYGKATRPWMSISDTGFEWQRLMIQAEAGSAAWYRWTVSTTKWTQAVK